tara:strand:- start:26283 stop:26912 length:630 start_codon:yes stop_codon:yes gene_type:complete
VIFQTPTELVSYFVIGLFSYLVGSISFAILASKFRGLRDPRSYGSNNPGATNVLRTGDKIAAISTLLGDILKGYVVIFSIYFLVTNEILSLDLIYSLSIGSLSVFLGHLYPIFFKFKGGKGVATAFGVILGIDHLLGICSLLVWIAVFVFCRVSALSAVITALIIPFLSLVIIRDVWGVEADILIIVQFFISILLIFRHKQNILSLLNS